MRNLIGTEEAERMAALYAEGWSPAEIGRVTGRNATVVRRHLQRLGVYVPVGRIIPERDRRGIVAWYERGVRLEDIQRRFGVGRATVYFILRERGVTIRYPSISAGMKRAR